MVKLHIFKIGSVLFAFGFIILFVVFFNQASLGNDSRIQATAAIAGLLAIGGIALMAMGLKVHLRRSFISKK